MGVVPEDDDTELAGMAEAEAERPSRQGIGTTY